MKISGAVHPLVKHAVVTGSLAGNQMLDLHIAINRPEESNKALDQLIQSQVNPSSSQYHHWLTPAQVGAQYGASSSDIQQISNWLTSNHLAVTGVNPARNMIHVRGNVQTIQNVFQTQLKTFTVAGKTRYANVVEPSIPAAFAQAINGVHGLHNIPMQANAHHLNPTPNFVSYNHGNNQSIADIVTQVNLGPLYRQSMAGAGVSVAIVGEALVDTGFVSNYLQQSGVKPAHPLMITQVPGFDQFKSSAAAVEEAYLDVELVTALAYGANVNLVVGSQLFDAIDFVVQNDVAGIVSIAYGLPETALGDGDADFISQLYQQAAAQGITVVVSTGDSGVTAAEDGTQAASTDLQVSAMAATPYNVAVGGSEFDPRFALPVISGVTDPSKPTFSRYIAEAVYNHSCTNYPLAGTLSAPDVVTYYNYKHSNDQGLNIYANGGGISSCAYNSKSAAGVVTCLHGYPVPAWQTGVIGIQPRSGRTIPDISMDDDYTIYCYQVHVPCTIAALGVFDSWAGTSVATQVFASVLAVAEQSQVSASNPQGRLGLVNPLLYQLAANQYGSSAANAKPLLASCNASQTQSMSPDCIFNDITTGNNGVPCDVHNWHPLLGANPSAHCDVTLSHVYPPGYAYYGVLLTADGNLAYSATPGYDLASGLDSVNAANFAKALKVLGAVQDLKATVSGTTATLTWTADANATSYNLYKGSSAGYESTTPVMQNISGTSAQVTGLVVGQTYFFKVAAVTQVGVGALSNEASVAVPPDVPAGLSSSTAGTSVTLSWSPSANATSYSVYQGSTAGGEASTPVATGLTKTTYTANSLSPGATLYFTVVAVNNGAVSVFSAEQSQAVVPGAPSGLTAQAGNGSVQLNWTAGTGASLYNVYMGNSAGGEAATPAVKSIGGTSVLISNLTNGSAYYFTVKSVNSGGESAATSEVNATPAAPKGGGDIGALGLALLMGLGLMKHRQSKH